MLHILFALGILVFLVVCLVKSVRKADVDYLIMGIILSSIATLVMTLLTVAALSLSPRIKIGENRQPIASLWSESSSSGQFFLGSGTTNGTNYYYFMKEVGKNQYERESIASDGVIIEESETESPRFQYDILVNRQHWLCPFDVPVPRCKKTNNYKLFVPRGTVIKEFTDRSVR
jgi:hypothetical protein